MCNDTTVVMALVIVFVFSITYRLASQVLLATLSIPVVPVTSESTRFLHHDSFVHEKDRRLASLLRLAVTPTRHSLHKDLVGIC